MIRRNKRGPILTVTSVWNTGETGDINNRLFSGHFYLPMVKLKLVILSGCIKKKNNSTKLNSSILGSSKLEYLKIR